MKALVLERKRVDVERLRCCYHFVEHVVKRCDNDGLRRLRKRKGHSYCYQHRSSRIAAEAADGDGARVSAADDCARYCREARVTITAIGSCGGYRGEYYEGW